MNPAQTQANVNQAHALGDSLQNYYNNQTNMREAQYQQSFAGAESNQANLQNYASQLAGQNYGDIYGQHLKGAQSMYGFDPTQLLKANMALANTNTTLANLPQAVQQQGNYYGTTAGQQAANYGNQAGNLNTVLAGQSNTVKAYQDLVNATQQQANQQTTQQLGGQQLALSGYQQAANNAAQIMQNAGTALNNIEQLQQQQGYLTAEQVAAYQNAYSTYMSAQAAQTNAAAAMIQSQATAGLYGAQTAGINQGLAAANKSAPTLSQLGGGGGLTVGQGSGLQGY